MAVGMAQHLDPGLGVDRVFSLGLRGLARALRYRGAVSVPLEVVLRGQCLAVCRSAWTDRPEGADW